MADGGRLPGRRLPGGSCRGLDVMRAQRRAWATVLAWPAAAMNSPLTSSAGRLFDAVAALLGVRDAINYEGQAAVELEQLAVTSRPGSAYRAGIADGPPFRVAGADLVRAVAEDLLAGRAAGGRRGPVPPRGGRRDRAACAMLRERTGLGTVALSGGVFQNLLLLGPGRQPAGGQRLPGADPLPGAAQRRRDQPRPGGRGRGAGPGRAAGLNAISALFPERFLTAKPTRREIGPASVLSLLR